MNAAELLPENEYALIREIAKSPSATQRELSQTTGFSLGMTNLMIKRLVRKGSIKVRQLDWKRTQYLLTPKGALEKAVKSYRYGLYTIRIFKQIRDNIRTVLRRELESGRRDFAVVAQDELLDIVRESVAEPGVDAARLSYHRSYAELGPEDRFVLSATLETAPGDGREVVILVDFDDIDFRIS